VKRIVVLTLFAATLTGCEAANRLASNVFYPFKALNKAFPGNELSLAELPNDDGPIIFYCHGNFQNIKSLLKYQEGEAEALFGFGFMQWLHQRGHVVIPEYPGINPVSGEPSEPVIMAKVKADFEMIKNKYPGRDIVVIGWSLGAAVASHLTKSGVDSLILISPWTSAKEAAKAHRLGFLVRWVGDDFWHKNSWLSLKTLESYGGELAVIHGKKDRLIPVSHGEAIAGKKLVDPVIVESGHNDILVQSKTLDSIEVILKK
jgi:fermentation-respiration switch protein FrsA (DUF1100 family)